MRLFNTLSRETEEFKPSLDNNVSFYSCGPTVYDYLHIGNWSTYLRWDILFRVLTDNGYNVKWIMNITDVGHLTSDADEGEDKLEKGAKREGKSAWEVADFYTQDFKRGLKFLDINIGEQGKLVKATDHIRQQIELVQKLDEKGFLYKIDGDGMYFDTSKIKDYGRLARLDIEGLRAGARIDIGNKKQATDFAVWKFSRTGQKRDMEWDSPWGVGFPGWHLECSAMAMEYLGETIDIHAGGIDHIPVHHTNEIAQSEAVTGKQFARFWLHSNFLLVDQQKIAKSSGNGITLQAVVSQGFDGQDVRMLVLQSHYRTEASFTWEILQAAHNRLKNWQAVASLRWQPEEKTAASDIVKRITDASRQLRAHLRNDLNTPEALSALDQVFDYIAGIGLSKDTLKEFHALLQETQQLLGINLFDEDITDEQKRLMHSRLAARENKEWKISDELRDRLSKDGIELQDVSTGQRWYRK